ncbi:MAG TPA: glycolate oxidase subunit GlcE [Azospirillaceae bacterium]|nr:glycolate oxidase subunit GlcE [Azospirillaceae bacterium]
MATFTPETDAQVLDAVRWALDKTEPLELVGRGSKRGLGRPVQAPHRLDLSGLAGIVAYEPEELVLTARAGTDLGEVAAALNEKGQAFAFEPPDLGPLLGAPAWTATLGGMVGAGWAGPRRLKAGSVRDHLLGFEAVSGRGEAFKAGGRVVKNVTGYDLPKLAAGSFGTLVALTSVTLKVLPAPQTGRTLLLEGLDDAQGIAALSLALGGPAEVSGAAHLPAGIAVTGKPDGVAVTALRLEGVAPSVEYRLEGLKARLPGASRLLGPEETMEFWRALRDVHPFVEQRERPVWRLSVPPSDGAAVAARLGKVAPGADWYFDWGGGLIWAALPAGPALAREVRGCIGRGGGHATLVRAPAADRAADPFHPQPPALAALSARVKDQFDPKHILNPGRLHSPAAEPVAGVR